MINRLLIKSFEKFSESILILGPRQTGKSTFLSSLHPELSINFSDEETFFQYISNMGLFTEQIKQSKAKTIFVDEIQRIPNLLNSIQYLINQAKQTHAFLQFYLSVSSARKLRQGQANLLPGRVFVFYMGGLCAKEVDYALCEKRALKYGFLPKFFTETNGLYCEKMLTAYTATYLKEEIQAEALTKDLPGFSRFLIIMASKAGQCLDLTKFGHESKVSRTHIRQFIDILEDTLIAQRVTCFNLALDADVVKHDKIYFFDIGVLNGLLNNFIASADRIGVLFEHLVLNQIQNSAFAHNIPVKIEFFRTRHGLEVDFIVHIQGEIWAIEAQAGDVNPQDLRGLLGFQKYFPSVNQCVVVTLNPIKHFKEKENILVCNTATLLQEMGF